MKATVIPKLTAPGGGTPLRVATLSKQSGDEIIQGTVLSTEQGIFHIRDGILDMLPLGVGNLSSAQSTNLAYPVARFYENPWRVNSLTLMSGQPLHIAREKNIIFDLLGKPEGTLWLDLAASSGLYSRWLAPKIEAQGGEVICLDFSVVMLREAQRYAQAEQISTINFVAARGERLPFANGTLDGVLCGGSLNEFGTTGVHSVLQDLYRALKLGGVGVFMHLLTATRPVGTLFQNFVARPGGIAFWSLEETHTLFTQAGFSVEQSKEFGMVAFTRIVKNL
jgi:ubiquinone/menaquinone biosynthesis C-methylase UbiE